MVGVTSLNRMAREVLADEVISQQGPDRREGELPSCEPRGEKRCRARAQLRQRSGGENQEEQPQQSGLGAVQSRRRCRGKAAPDHAELVSLVRAWGLFQVGGKPLERPEQRRENEMGPEH